MIVVFGSINVDLLFGVNKLPQAGETVLCADYSKAAGGKGLNQAVAAARSKPISSLPVHMVGCAGNDQFGDVALDTLANSGADISGVTRSSTPTACAAVLVDRMGENQIVVASGANNTLAAEALPDTWLGTDTVLVLQMEVPLQSNCEVIKRAKRRGARVVLNLAPAGQFPEDLIPALDLLVLNELEASTIAGHNGLQATSAQAVAKEIASHYSVATVVSLGAAGACAFSPIDAWKIGALPITPIDTVGAGDAFVGGLAVGLMLGLSLPEMILRASIGAGLSCQSEGAARSMPTAAEIEARLGDLTPARRL